MKKHAVLSSALMIASLFTLAGCASSGNESLRQETKESISTKIFEGKTTKDEVRATLGAPASTTFTDGGQEIWKYDRADIQSDAVNFVPVVNWFGSSYSGTKKELTILFDPNGIIKKYSWNDSPVSTKSGAFK